MIDRIFNTVGRLTGMLDAVALTLNREQTPSADDEDKDDDEYFRSQGRRGRVIGKGESGFWIQCKVSSPFNALWPTQPFFVES